MKGPRQYLNINAFSLFVCFYLGKALNMLSTCFLASKDCPVITVYFLLVVYLHCFDYAKIPRV